MSVSSFCLHLHTHTQNTKHNRLKIERAIWMLCEKHALLFYIFIEHNMNLPSSDSLYILLLWTICANCELCKSGKIYENGVCHSSLAINYNQNYHCTHHTTIVTIFKQTKIMSDYNQHFRSLKTNKRQAK